MHGAVTLPAGAAPRLGIERAVADSPGEDALSVLTRTSSDLLFRCGYASAARASQFVTADTISDVAFCGDTIAEQAHRGAQHAGTVPARPQRSPTRSFSL